VALPISLGPHSGAPRIRANYDHEWITTWLPRCETCRRRASYQHEFCTSFCTGMEREYGTRNGIETATWRCRRPLARLAATTAGASSTRRGGPRGRALPTLPRCALRSFYVRFDWIGLVSATLLIQEEEKRGKTKLIFFSSVVFSICQRLLSSLDCSATLQNSLALATATLGDIPTRSGVHY
jgi:hypothetical protein